MAAGAPAGPAPLTVPGVAADGITVSGLSSGGYMAAQFHVAHAASLVGAAVLAGEPMRHCSRTAPTWMTRSTPRASGST